MARDSSLIAAVDLGGTYTKIAMVDREGTVRAQTKLPTKLTAFDDGDHGIGTLDWLADEVIDFAGAQARTLSETWRGFGVILPGVIDASNGLVRAAANIGWYDVPVALELATRLGVPGGVDHDVRTAGLAEWRLGAGKGSQQLLFVPLGTGIAAATIVDGNLLEADGYAGEIGHLPVPAAGKTACACGGIGCLETVASAAGVSRSYRRMSGNAGPVSGEHIADLARCGDDAAADAFRIAAEALSQALLATLTITGCELVVFGGGLSGAADLLLPTIESAFDDRMTIQRRPRLTISQFGNEAGIVGAGLLGWQACDASAGGSNR